MTTETQLRRIMAKLRNKDPVTQAHAFGWSPPIGRLSARIKDLRDMGHRIGTQMVPNTHNSGRHAVYRLIEEAENDS